MNIKRYEIYFADLNPTIGSEIKKVRPVVIISQDEMNKYLGTVVVCPLTSKLHPQWRTRLQIKCANKNAEIAVEQVRTISKQRLQNKIDILSKGGIHFTGLDDRYQQFSYMAPEGCIPPALTVGKIANHEPLMFGG